MAPIEFDLTFADYVHAQRLHAKQSGWRRFSLVLFCNVFPLLGTLGILAGILMLRDRVSSDDFVVLGLSLLLLSYPLLVRLNWKYCFKRTRSNRGRCMFDFGDDLFRTASSVSRSEVQWCAIQSVAEDENSFLLYTARAMFFPIPKRACSPSQIEELRQLLQSKVIKYVSKKYGKAQTID